MMIFTSGRRRLFFKKTIVNFKYFFNSWCCILDYSILNCKLWDKFLISMIIFLIIVYILILYRNFELIFEFMALKRAPICGRKWTKLFFISMTIALKWRSVFSLFCKIFEYINLWKNATKIYFKAMGHASHVTNSVIGYRFFSPYIKFWMQINRLTLSAMCSVNLLTLLIVVISSQIRILAGHKSYSYQKNQRQSRRC